MNVKNVFFLYYIYIYFFFIFLLSQRIWKLLLFTKNYTHLTTIEYVCVCVCWFRFLIHVWCLFELNHEETHLYNNLVNFVESLENFQRMQTVWYVRIFASTAYTNHLYFILPNKIKCIYKGKTIKKPKVQNSTCNKKKDNFKIVTPTSILQSVFIGYLLDNISFLRIHEMKYI